ncbi:hypothetical protein H6A66_01000 [Bacteroides caecigallinarum]|uniref:SecDF P1 head subdomain-containing protein n=1 Tax=Bacteroides caecigallinarum TaxID=1411144 RepID=UPI001957FBF7|nr:hypothetical protein [Bacteroides caecigallinarum]MBM6863769.1 hypothetical protein [Bacteroides caecigallinarum]
MKAINYLFFFFIILNISCTHRPQISHRENGWYHYENDSLSSEPIVTVKEFTGLKLDSDMHGTYVILGQISKHKTEKWADETEKSIGKQIAFVLNDSIITNPQVNDRIGSGTFLISSVNDKDLPHIYKQLVKEKSDSIEALFKGWEKDSLYYTLDQRQKDSIIISLDYIEAKDWLDMTRKETSEQ